MKIFSIVGARPQFIKLATLSALWRFSREIIVHTGQHYDYAMSEKIFADLRIRKPDIHLEVGSGSNTFKRRRWWWNSRRLCSKRAGMVVVFGDTNSTLAGAITAAKLNIPIIHIEVGLRSFNKSMQEEINRIISDHVSKYLLLHTQCGEYS